MQSITLRTSDNEFVEGAVHCLLCLLSRAEADKRTLLFGDHVKVPDLTKLVEVVPANQGTSDDNPGRYWEIIPYTCTMSMYLYLGWHDTAIAEHSGARQCRGIYS